MATSLGMILNFCLIMVQPCDASAEGSAWSKAIFHWCGEWCFTHKSCTHGHMTCKRVGRMLEMPGSSSLNVCQWKACHRGSRRKLQFPAIRYDLNQALSGLSSIVPLDHAHLLSILCAVSAVVAHSVLPTSDGKLPDLCRRSRPVLHIMCTYHQHLLLDGFFLYQTIQY